MMEIGTFEAENRLPELIQKVQEGESFLITNRGQPVACLIPAHVGHNVEKARETAKRLREWANKAALGSFAWDEWKDCRDEGRH